MLKCEYWGFFLLRVICEDRDFACLEGYVNIGILVTKGDGLILCDWCGVFLLWLGCEHCAIKCGVF